MNIRSIIVAVALIASGMIAGVLLVSSFSEQNMSRALAFPQERPQLGGDKPTVKIDDKASALNNAFIAVSNEINQTVVSISVITEEDRSQRFEDSPLRFFGFPDEGRMPEKFESQSSGSGVFISEDGYIVTNNHVIENAKDGGIKIITNDRHEYIAKLVGRDPLTDLAVVKVESDEKFRAASFGNSDKAQVGEWVIACGNPLGLRSTITAGIISAIGRGQLGVNRSSSYAVEDFIQTDAAINPGNSGGGLFNLQGELVGINTAIASRTGYFQGYGFAIPTNLVQSVASDLIEDGKINRGYIGVQIRTIDEAFAKALGLTDVSGVLVDNVLSGSAGEEAGIQTEDVILKVDGEEVNSSNQLQSLIVRRRAGDNVRLTLWRDGKEITKTVTLKPRDGEETLASKKTQTKETEEEVEMKPMKMDNLGFTMEPLTEKMRSSLDIETGVLVSEVERFSVAAERGLRPGDVIVRADRKNVLNPQDLAEIFTSKTEGSAILLKVISQGRSRIIAIEIPETAG